MGTHPAARLGQDISYSARFRHYFSSTELESKSTSRVSAKASADSATLSPIKHDTRKHIEIFVLVGVTNHAGACCHNPRPCELG